MAALLLLLLVGGGFAVWTGLRQRPQDVAQAYSLTPPLAAGPLRLTVLATGALEAQEAHVVTNRVEGRTTIISLVPEGTVITEEDVANHKVLVRLDTSNIEERVEKQALEVKNARAQVVNAQSNLDIQRHQNESDIRKGALDLRFAHLDLERYVGSELAKELTRRNVAPATPKGDGPKALAAQVAGLLEDPRLGGEAMQKIRTFDADITLADEELRRAQDKFNNSKRLHDKGYLSGEELDADRLAEQRRKIDAEKARTARVQFATYDFAKEVQRLLSDVVEAAAELDRIQAKATAAEARVVAEVRSKSEQASLKEERLKRLMAQCKECVICATKPGLVVYGSTNRGHRWRDNEQIREGTEVRERQELLRIPEAGKVALKVGLHESVVRHCKVGQRAWVTVDAKPGVRIPATVEKIARMPSSVDSWLNKDLKVYNTVILLEGNHPQFKPGMSASAEIVTAELEDVLAVPIQAVVGPTDDPRVFVQAGNGIEERSVTLGPSSEQMAVIASGLSPGMRVVLNPPTPHDAGGIDATDEEPGDDAATPKKPARPKKHGQRGR